ncbi:hypothetical protein INT47_007224 [Mucor saturninus]|uniref:Uncharacterized protein n=1 Tax=Mucor saturninus TaxID=64648 RepID=A0A8H7R6D5_9FUNG|nr:hypothetical protein INT47_007224 [Mucor saturninus]
MGVTDKDTVRICRFLYPDSLYGAETPQIAKCLTIQENFRSSPSKGSTGDTPLDRAPVIYKDTFSKSLSPISNLKSIDSIFTTEENQENIRLRRVVPLVERKLANIEYTNRSAYEALAQQIASGLEKISDIPT